MKAARARDGLTRAVYVGVAGEGDARAAAVTAVEVTFGEATVASATTTASRRPVTSAVRPRPLARGVTLVSYARQAGVSPPPRCRCQSGHGSFVDGSGVWSKRCHWWCRDGSLSATPDETYHGNGTHHHGWSARGKSHASDDRFSRRRDRHDGNWSVWCPSG